MSTFCVYVFFTYIPTTFEGTFLMFLRGLLVGYTTA